ncbi:MAG: 2-phosphosulfolactate phosphatase, partial [Bacteroidales bacterium]
MDGNKLEVCLSPLLYEQYRNPESITVVVDVLRATSAICAALDNGAEALIPVATVDEARSYKTRGYLVAAERDGYILDFADFGNSPFNFKREVIEGKEIVYSTTNGTMTVELAGSSHMVVIGSFLNITALSQWLL